LLYAVPMLSPEGARLRLGVRPVHEFVEGVRPNRCAGDRRFVRQPERCREIRVIGARSSTLEVPAIRRQGSAMPGTS